MTNSCRARLSIRVFYPPGFDAEIGPALEIIDKLSKQSWTGDKVVAGSEKKLDWKERLGSCREPVMSL